MTDLLLKTYDRFAVLYDLLELLNEGMMGESALASSARISRLVVNEMLAFMVVQGYVKTTKNDTEFKITTLGSNFLQDFKGMRRFLS